MLILRSQVIRAFVSTYFDRLLTVLFGFLKLPLILFMLFSVGISGVSLQN